MNKIVKIQTPGAEKYIGIAYHGSDSVFQQFDQKKSRIVNDFYGGGIAYFTTNKEIGQQYAKSMAKTKKSNTPILYTVRLRLQKVFDVDHIYTGSELVSILPIKIEEFARGAGLLSYNVNSDMVLFKLTSGKMELTGDQIFKGLSKGMTRTAEARSYLIKLGFDGLRYNGGLNMNTHIKHDVYLVYKTSGITIKEVEAFDMKK